jgi:hypothetical protein
MWIVILAFLLWAVVIAVSARLWVIGGESVVWGAGRRILWCMLLLIAAVLFLRPHEDIFGGQDTGAYITGSAVFAREGSLSYPDPLLSQLAEDERVPFVTTKHYSSKYHCLWLPHFPEPTMRTWFQPAYPIMAGLLTHLFPPGAVLYVIPLMAILAGLAIRALASRLFDHPWAGEAAFVCYVLNPLVVWHARYPRSEVIANFLLMGGLCLLVFAWRKGRGVAWGDLLLGALCLNLAPFFHVSSWMVVIIVSVLVVLAILAGRDDFLLFPLVAGITFFLFLYQAFVIADPYGLARFVRPVMPYRPALTVIGATLTVLLYGVSWFMRRRRTTTAQHGETLTSRVGPVLRLGGAVLILGAFLVVAWLAYHTSADELKKYITRYLWRTDLRCVVEMISLPTALLGLAGVVVMALRSGRGTAERWVVLAALVPASLVIGNFYDFFMTRYMMIVILSLLTLGLTAAVTLIPATGVRGIRLFTAALILVCLLGMHNRSLLIQHVQFKGFTRYMAEVADEVKQVDGMALCEYTQFAAPLDLFFGVPTLGLSNERLWDYADAETAWLGLMRRNPGKRAFFITPYERPPVSKRFLFVPHGLREYAGERIMAHRWALPTAVADWGCGLRMYEMFPVSGDDSGPSEQALPWVGDFGYGNMGLHGFEAPRGNPAIQTSCLRLHPETPLSIPLKPASGEQEIWLIACSDDASQAKPSVRLEHGGAVLPGNLQHLINDWWLYRTDLPASEAETLTGALKVYGGEHTLLSAVRRVSGDNVDPLFDAWQTPASEPYTVGPFDSRWASRDSSFSVPVPARGNAYLLSFVLAPHEWGDYALLHVRSEKEQQRRVPTGRFVWDVWVAGGDANASHVASVSMESRSAGSGDEPAGVTTMPVALGYAAIVEQ